MEIFRSMQNIFSRNYKLLERYEITFNCSLIIDFEMYFNVMSGVWSRNEKHFKLKRVLMSIGFNVSRKNKQKTSILIHHLKCGARHGNQGGRNN